MTFSSMNFPLCHPSSFDDFGDLRKLAVSSDAHQIQVDAPLVGGNGLKVKHSQLLEAAFMDSLSEPDKTIGGLNKSS